MTYLVTLAPSFEPLTVAEARAHLRLCCADEDTYLAHLITTAREYVEAIIGGPLGQQTREYLFPCFGCELDLPPNLLTVTSIEYIDTGGNTQTLDPASYHVDTASQPGKVTHVAAIPWPDIAAHTPNPIKVTVIAGYPSADAIPPASSTPCCCWSAPGTKTARMTASARSYTPSAWALSGCYPVTGCFNAGRQPQAPRRYPKA